MIQYLKRSRRRHAAHCDDDNTRTHTALGFVRWRRLSIASSTLCTLFFKVTRAVGGSNASCLTSDETMRRTDQANIGNQSLMFA